MTPFYAVGTHSAKVHMNELQDWILANLELEDSLSQTYKAFGQDAFNPKSDHITFYNKCVTVKDKSNLTEGIDVKIQNCEDSYVYINQYVDCLHISECLNTTVFCAAVKRVATVSNCEGVNLTVAAGVVRVGNCVDCTINTYTHFGAPIIYGDTRNLSLAPHNASYVDLNENLVKSGINVSVADFPLRQQYFTNPSLMHVAKQSIIMQSPIDFMRLSLPKQFGADAPLTMCPQDPYVNIMNMRMARFADI